MASFRDIKAKRDARHIAKPRIAADAEESLAECVEDKSSTPSDLPGGSERYASSSTSRSPPETSVGDPAGSDVKVTAQAGESIEHAEAETLAFGFAAAGLTVGRRRGRGRGLYATKAFKPGQNIYASSSRPPATVLSTKLLTTHCSNCCLSPSDAALLAEREEGGMKRCGACRASHYCSAVCAREDWPAHKAECTTFQKLREAYKSRHPGEKIGLAFVPHESIRAFGRLLWEKRRCMSAGEPEVSWDQYALLQSSLDPERLDALRKQVYRLAFYLSVTAPLALQSGGEMALALLLKDYGVTGNPEVEMMKMISRYQVNAFTLDSPDLTPLGVSVNPALGMANHSCDPNAVVLFPEGKGRGQLVAIKDIRPGEEVSICYTDVATPRSARRAELLERYGFACDCALCERREWVDPRWAVRHPGCDRRGVANVPEELKWEQVAEGKGFSGIVAARCTCGAAFGVDLAKLHGVLLRGKSSLQADERGDEMGSETSVAALQECIEALSAIMPPTSHPLIPLNRLLCSITPVSTPDLQRAYTHLQQAIAGAEGVYTAHHPTLAVLAVQRARIESLLLTPGEEPAERSQQEMHAGLTRLRRMLEAHKLALGRCQASFGKEGGLLGKGERMQVEGLEREIGAARMALESQ